MYICILLIKYKHMNNIFKNMNHESAYILGYFWADANLTNNSLDIELNEKDKYILDKFNRIICDSKNKIYRRERNNSVCYRLIITNKEIASTLRDIGFAKKNDRIIPKINEEFIYSFIRGYFDGDGCFLMKTKNLSTEYRVDIAGRKDFIEFIEQYLPACSRYEIINWKTCVSKRIYYFGKEKVKNFLNIIKPTNINEDIFLERKHPVLH